MAPAPLIRSLLVLPLLAAFACGPAPQPVEEDPRDPEAEKALGRVLPAATEAVDTIYPPPGAEQGALERVQRLLRGGDFDDLLESVLVALEYSEAETARMTLRNNRIEMRELTERIQELREASFGAPEDVGALEGLYKDSKEELEEQLEDAQERLAELKDAEAELRLRFIEEMRGLGLELDEEAVDTLLGTATGEDFTDLVVATHTVRKIAVQLERLAAEPDAPPTAARRYYGVYLVMLRAMEHVHVTFVERIEGELVPRLAELSAEAAKLIERADAREAEGGDPELAAQNRQANQLTIRACELYTEFLEQQAAHVGGRIEGLRSSIEDAEVTYATLSISSEVAAMIRSGLQDLDALMELEPPQMARLETPELREEFRRLSERMVQP